MIARDADVLERLQEAQRSGDRRDEANSLFVLGKRAGQRGEHRAAGRHFAESAQIWRELGDHQGLVESVNSIGISAAWCGDYALAKASMELTIELARRLNDTGALVRAMANLGAFAADNYDLETARRWCAESISLARQSDDAARAARATYNLAWVAFLEGQYEEARRLATDSESALHGHSMAVVEALAAMLQGRLNLRRRNFVIARPQLEYALKTLEAMGDADDSGLAAFLLGVADVLEGIEDGWERLEGSLSRVVKPANRAELALALAGLGGVMRRRGDADHARLCVELGLAVSRSAKDRATEAIALSVAAELENDLGQNAPAAQTRKAAARAWKDALRGGSLKDAVRKAVLDVDAGA